MGRRALGEASAWSRELVRAVAKMRDDAGLTNQELVDRTGMSTSYFYARLRGASPFDTNDIERLAIALGTHPHEISRVAAALSGDAEPIEPTVELNRKELARRVKLVVAAPLDDGASFDLDSFVADLERRGVALEAGEWKAITTPSATGPVRARVLEALAAVSGVAPGYFLALGDEELREATEAQLDFRSALRETGADSVAARAVGEVSPSALRAIAASLRSAGR